MKSKVVAFSVFLGLLLSAFGQDYAPPPAPEGQLLSSEQLYQMLGPIALYPDPLISEILPACAQPAQIAIAYTYISSGNDPNSIDQQNWDPNVQAVAHYPDVLKMLNDNLAWATQIGQAYVNQPDDVMTAIQGLRAQAMQLGNLQNIPNEEISSDDGDIDILPTDPDLLYVPIYDPSLIFYTPGYGRSFITFGAGFRIGPWFNHDFDWHGHRIIAWDAGHPRPANWWHEAPAARRGVIARAPVFHPPAHVTPVGRPGVYGRGDRGYAPVPAAGRPVESRPPVVRPAEPRPAPARPVEPRPEPRPATPARPVVFPNESASETRAASFRGAASRGAPAPAPAPRGGGGSGGGGGGGSRKR